MNMLEDLSKLLISLIISLLGGLVKTLNKVKQPTMSRIVKEMIISGFTGVMVFYLIRDVTWLTEGMKMFLVGMGGYSGSALLDYLESTSNKFFKKLA